MSIDVWYSPMHTHSTLLLILLSEVCIVCKVKVELQDLTCEGLQERERQRTFKVGRH